MNTKELNNTNKNSDNLKAGLGMAGAAVAGAGLGVLGAELNKPNDEQAEETPLKNDAQEAATEEQHDEILTPESVEPQEEQPIEPQPVVNEPQPIVEQPVAEPIVDTLHLNRLPNRNPNQLQIQSLNRLPNLYKNLPRNRFLQPEKASSTLSQTLK